MIHYLVPLNFYLSVSTSRVTIIFISLPSLPFYSTLFNGFSLSIPVLAAAPDIPLDSFLESIFIFISTHTFLPLSCLCFMLASFFQSPNIFLHSTLHFSSHSLIQVFIYFNSTYLQFINNPYLPTYDCLHRSPWSDFRFLLPPTPPSFLYRLFIIFFFPLMSSLQLQTRHLVFHCIHSHLFYIPPSTLIFYITTISLSLIGSIAISK